jgi:catechol 2,3-dioxygenase-like lactoylglutathione lyase family enzyme
MPIIGIHHVQLAMPAGQEALAREFYRDILGLAETPKPDDLAARGGCWFETAYVRIHLGVDKSFHPATKAHPGLLVTDLQALTERCREKGFEIAQDAPLDGYHRVYVNDPFGNRLELLQKA